MGLQNRGEERVSLERVEHGWEPQRIPFPPWKIHECIRVIHGQVLYQGYIWVPTKGWRPMQKVSFPQGRSQDSGGTGVSTFPCGVSLGMRFIPRNIQRTCW